MTASCGEPMRRVLIIVENLPVPFDRRVWSEATALQRAGYAVSVICPTGRDAEARYEVIEGVHVYRHPLPVEGHGLLGYAAEYAAALFWEFRLAVRVLRERGFDAIHACNPPDLIFLVGGFFKLFGKKFVFDHHDINPELYEAKFGRRDWGWRLMLLLERLTFRIADLSIATNGSYRQIAIERGGMPPDRVHVVRSGPSLSRIRELPPDPAWRKGRRFLVGYVGVIGQQEGIDLLLEAVRHIVAERGRTDVQFVIVGGGPALAEMQEASAALKVSDYVTFTGRVPDETLFSALSTADVCVNPDRPNAMNDKSTMNKIMEYMALGKPIVQFDLTEGRVSAGEASLYARNTEPSDFGEKILDLLADPERRAAMGAFGRRRVHEELAWPYEEPKLLAAYEQLFAGAPARVEDSAPAPTRVTGS
ncbi:glycosyltransferase family 4 protein [Methylobacterium nodulans]|uniref:Glycosyl transferase group 1 n=1 Tax=Methylobacterium nodulans (strain LMG 21967 / CNCM I-2342 / ORS 2060) TaxID=460265 RepID=B8ISR0_METNO|nr:glycosyltransferase family 4 protein [Methylobacterium nodulans]ACL60709.1 glycosyl transferase group 1 [Methylobacterium nodulans ORS 2060]